MKVSLLFIFTIFASAIDIDFNAVANMHNSEKKTTKYKSKEYDKSKANKILESTNKPDSVIVNKIGEFVKDIGKNSANMSSIKKSCLAQTEYGSSYCHGIKDSDIKASCLAQTKYGSSHCFSIKNSDIKASCLAQTKYGSSHCFSIKNSDIKASCLAQTKYGSSNCYGIGNAEMKKSCIAQVKGKSSLCY